MARDAAMSPEQAATRLGQLQGWQIEEAKKLTKSYRFGNFIEAVHFVNKITPVAERRNHHPDLLVRWGEVRVELSTHSAGGLTDADFGLAAEIDTLAG